MRETATVMLLTVLYSRSVAASPCADQTQRGLDACAGAARDKADAALNGVYKQIVARLADDPGKTKRLIEAEKAWIAFRDAECAFANSDTEGGRLDPLHGSHTLRGEAHEHSRAAVAELSQMWRGGHGMPVPAK